MRRIAGVRWLLCLVVLGAPALWAEEPAAPGAGDADPSAPLELEEPVEPLVPARPRTEADRDRLEALSLFAAGRMKERDDDLAGALRLYQRALRHDPRALPVLRQVIKLAFDLDRSAEAVRYALKAVELDPSDPLWLRELGVVLTKQGDLAGALQLYQKALALQTDKRTAAYTMLTMEAAKLYYLNQDYARAADAFSEVMAALEKSADFGIDDMVRQAILAGDAPAAESANAAGRTYELFADAFLAAGRPDPALAAFEKAQEAAPNQALHAYHLARVHAHRGEPAKALDDLPGYFDARETRAQTAPYELLAKVLRDLGREAELVERLESLRAHDPANASLAYYLAERYRQAGKPDQAEPLYAELVKNSPSANAYQGLVAIYRQTKRCEALLEVLGDAAAKSGGLDVLGEEAQAVAGDSELFTGLAEAARARHAADADSLGYGARRALGQLALAGKRFDVADEFFNLALKVKSEDSAEILLTWGTGLLAEERFADAARVFQRGIDERALPADNPAFYFYLSAALAMDDKTDLALDAARTAGGLGRNSVRLESRIPWILYHAKRYPEAAQAYRDLIAKFDSEHKSQEVRQELRQARLVLSNIYVLQDDLRQAEEWLEQVLDEYPEDVSALNDLGYLWADQGKNLDRALHMVQRAVASEPDNAAYRDSLGWALYKLGRYEEALVELQKAAGEEEPDGVILDHLGDAYLALGRSEPAREAWQRALASFEKQGDAAKAQRAQEKLEKHTAPAGE